MIFKFYSSRVVYVFIQYFSTKRWPIMEIKIQRLKSRREKTFNIRIQMYSYKAATRTRPRCAFYLNAPHRRRHHQEDPHRGLEEVILIAVRRVLHSGLGYAGAVLGGLAAHLAPYAAD